jgi:hypothetical protein
MLGLLALLWALLLAALPTVLSIWLVPIWRIARLLISRWSFPLNIEGRP